MPATAMPNGGPSPQNLEGVYTAIYLILSGADPQLAQEFQTFVRQSEYVQDRYNPSFSAHATQSYEEMLQEEQATQKWIDKVYKYVAPSLFVTSVLASGELVGSTIWGISKYVSKDIIWNTLGATTAAVILQSADLVGYKDEAQKLFGIKNTERRATLAITIGGQVGKALGAVAGTALSISIEAAAVGVVAPTLLPLVIGIGSFTGQRIGEVVGVGLGAGLNNLFFSTIGTLPASYQGIKQKGGKFVDRLKHSSEEKHKPAQKANNAVVPGPGEPGASSSVAVSGAGSVGPQNNSPILIPQGPANLAIVQQRLALPSSEAPVISPTERVVQNASQEPVRTNQQWQGGVKTQSSAVNPQILGGSKQKLEGSSGQPQNQQQGAEEEKANKVTLGKQREQAGQNKGGSNLITQQKQNNTPNSPTRSYLEVVTQKNVSSVSQPNVQNSQGENNSNSRAKSTKNGLQPVSYNNKQRDAPTVNQSQRKRGKNKSISGGKTPSLIKQALQQEDGELKVVEENAYTIVKSKKNKRKEKRAENTQNSLGRKSSSLPDQSGNEPTKGKFASAIQPKNFVGAAVTQGKQNNDKTKVERFGSKPVQTGKWRSKG